MRTLEKSNVEWFLQVISFIQHLVQIFIEHLLHSFSECGLGTSTTRDSGVEPSNTFSQALQVTPVHARHWAKCWGCQVHLTPSLPGGAWSPGRRQIGKNEILSAEKGLLSKG